MPLRDPQCEPVIFLSAEPGAGKTSVLSWLANRRPDTPFAGLIGARFFCFEPIRPEAPVIAVDASRVQPDDLWMSLLSQLREGLRGRLHELRVPLRNDLLTWAEARNHVLRLASIIGGERGERFVLVIDGIDHAARAAQAMPQQIREFFSSLPSPDELEQLAIRLLVAGQPAAYYSAQYPEWLQGQHPSVRHFSLPPLSTEDVQTLYDSANSQLPEGQRAEVIRLIVAATQGNTLATVFAVAETERTASLEDFAQLLDDRRLTDGLNTYYDSIWQHMLVSARDLATGVDACLVGAISLARGGLPPSLLADAFREWERPEAWWRTLLENLGPLLAAGDGGFRVRHNDVRVFLTTRFSRFSSEQRQHVVSQLADYYQRPTSDRLITHLQLFDLLEFAERSSETARIFSVEWVIEAAVVGIETEQLYRECMMAVRSLPLLKDWSLVGSVTCAAFTLARLNEAREHSSRHYNEAEHLLPPFLPSEAMVRPMTQWSLDDLHNLVFDGFQLVESGEHPRALALLQRWLTGLNVSTLIAQIADTATDDDLLPPMKSRRRVARLGQRGNAIFEQLGELCCILEWRFPRGRAKSHLKTDAAFAYERGFVKGLTESPKSKSLRGLFKKLKPHYLNNWIEAVRRLAKITRWDLVREMLLALTGSLERLDSTFRNEATWWALRSGAANDAEEWLRPLDTLDFSELKSRSGWSPGSNRESFYPLVNVARSLGWVRLDLDPGDIAEKVYQAFSPADHLADQKTPTVLVFQVAALLGRIEAAIHRSGVNEARLLVSVNSVCAVLSALWGDPVMSNYRFAHRMVAAELANELVGLCPTLGVDYDVAALAVAQPVAMDYPVDSRKDGLWAVLKRNGCQALLTSWIRHWLADDGKVWQLGHDEADEIVQSLVSFAKCVGEGDVAQRAISRLAWMPISYRSHKEYGFEQVLEWFRETSSRSPEIWKTSGWKLWCLCDTCDCQSGNNRFDDDVRTAISAAALRCGAPDWWSLVSATIPQMASEGWHWRTRELLVEGARSVLQTGMQVSSDDLLALWCIAVSFNMWFNKSETVSLGELRTAILNVASTDCQREELVAGLMLTARGRMPEQAFNIEEEAEESHQSAAVDTSDPEASEVSVDSLMARIADGGHVLPSEAARAVREIELSTAPNKAELRMAIFRALGADRSYAARWDYVEGNVAGSVHCLANVASDDELWLAVAALAREYKDCDYWPDSLASNLDRLAIERAKVRGFDELLVGLGHHLAMHSRWAFGSGPLCPEVWPTLPDPEPGLSWQDVAIRLIAVLLGSYSAEVLGAAMEGMHSLVAINSSTIPQLFRSMTTAWQRRWLLSAAEAWASLYPETIAEVSDDLQKIMAEGSLQERLQAWIILCKYCDVTDAPRPVLPLPDETANDSLAVRSDRLEILHIPPIQYGQRRLIDRLSGIEGTLQQLNVCGWDFSSLGGRIVEALPARGEESRVLPVRNGPHRRGDFSCTPLDAEIAMSRVILSVLRSETCDEAKIVQLAQGMLDNEDAWMQAIPFRPLRHTDLWPPDEYGADDEMSASEWKERLSKIAMTHDVPSGWNTFCAHVFFYTRKKDVELRLWWEQWGNDLLLGGSKCPTCPSGRSFLWWFGDFFEPKLDRFISGFFVGGKQRLSYGHFEIQPPKSWRDYFGWSPDPQNPLQWNHNGSTVAQYDRLHGPLRDTFHGPHCRQPVIERWLITEEAFREVEDTVGTLRLRDEFTVHDFKEW